MRNKIIGVIAVIITFIIIYFTNYINPSGKIYFSHDGGDLYGVIIQKGNIDALRISSRLDFIHTLDISIGGKYLCYGSLDHTIGKRVGDNKLMLYDFSTRNIDTLVNYYPISIDYPSFSPDNTQIAFEFWKAGTSHGFMAAQCALYSLASKSYKAITDYTLAMGKPSWVKDGKSLWVSLAVGEIVRIDLEGKIIEKLGKGFCPTLSPDGNYIAYTLDHNIYVFDIVKKKEKIIASWWSYYTPGEHFEIHLAWSPDSKFLLYQGRDPLSLLTSESTEYVVVSAHRITFPKCIKALSAAGAGADWVQ